MTLAGIRIQQLVAEILEDYRRQTGNESKVQEWQKRLEKLLKDQEQEEYINSLHGAN